MRRVLIVLGVGFVLFIGYFLLWPVPIDPVAWEAPPNPGYTGQFAVNQQLAALERVEVPGLTGPEDLAFDPEGTIYTTSHEGWIARRVPGSDTFEAWVDTDGRPLGVDWDAAGDRLVVADAFRGLMAVDRAGRLTLLTDEADGIPIRYADDVVAAADGTLYFSDASVKFGAEDWGGTYPASMPDIFEHAGHGRILAYDPVSGHTSVLMEGLVFANGVALTPGDAALLVVETGSYRVHLHHLRGARAGTTEVLLDNLPGYPDNLARGEDGRYWVGLVSERRGIVDNLAPRPFWRRVVQRLPDAVRPEATRYGHVAAFTLNGEIVMSLQDPSGDFARTTGAFEAEGGLWITSLHEPDLGWLPIAMPSGGS